MRVFDFILILPVVTGTVYMLLVMIAVRKFTGKSLLSCGKGELPAVTILKPVYGMERDLERNLRSACEQDYPEYQVVLSVQRLNDPALPLLQRLQDEYGEELVTIAMDESAPVVNGKVQNLHIAYKVAKHDLIVISDSDVFTRPDYLYTIIAPLQDPTIGVVSTMYRGGSACSWYEKMELLTYNAEFIPSVIFAYLTGATHACLGASMALRRSDLEAIGRFESLEDYLVEDYELGRRIKHLDKQICLIPYFVDLTVDLSNAKKWWQHQLYWDQNTRAANQSGFILSVLTKAIPFALVYAVIHRFNLTGSLILAFTTVFRLVTAADTWAVINNKTGRLTLLLLPLRDVIGLLSWMIILAKRTYIWRGIKFGITRDGRIIPRTS